MALLRPGWEEDYHKRPPIHAGVCVGRIAQEERLPDGRYNLLLTGLARARVLAEEATERLYRTARVELLAEDGVPNGATARELRQRLAARCKGGRRPARRPPARQPTVAQRPADRRLGDLVSYILPLPLELKQQLLEEAHVTRRLDALLSTSNAGRFRHRAEVPAGVQPELRALCLRFASHLLAKRKQIARHMVIVGEITSARPAVP